MENLVGNFVEKVVVIWRFLAEKVFCLTIKVWHLSENLRLAVGQLGYRSVIRCMGK